MLTLKRRRKWRVPPQRGRGAILGPLFCCAQCSMLAVGVPSGSSVLCRCDDCAQRRFRLPRAPRAYYAGPAMMRHGGTALLGKVARV
jgi:hypothetical protein